MVRRLNIDGDGQGDLAGHGGEHRAVLVYQVDSYRYWRGQLGRSDLSAGDFGENLTVDGLADDEVCVGDRYRIGDAVFEVSQPRVTCYRLGMRVGEPRLPALLVSHRRPGFYMRVLTEGRIEAGDAVVKLASGPERLTVAEVDGLLYLHEHPRDDLARALRVDALSPGWKASLAALLEQAGAGGSATGNPGLTTVGPPRAWEGFRELRVAGVDHETATVMSLRLAAPDGGALPAPLPGQYLTVRLVLDSGQTLVRNYSLSGPPGGREYRISVKREPHGLASGHIHTSIRTGQTIEVAAPRGTFTLVPGTGPLALVSAGVGVTPVLAMLHALAAESSTRPVYWIHGARNRGEDAFAAEVAGLLTTLGGARWSICYSSPSPTEAFGERGVTPGRVTAAVVERLGVPPDADVYVCGPAAFMTDMTAAFHALGFAPTHVRTETFGTLGRHHPRRRQLPRGPASPPGWPTGNGAGGDVQPQRTDGALGRSLPARCSSWPRRVASPSAGPAARACATPARRASCPVTWRTSPSPSTGRRWETCSSAARGRVRLWWWTSSRGGAGARLIRPGRRP